MLRFETITLQISRSRTKIYHIGFVPNVLARFFINFICILEVYFEFFVIKMRVVGNCFTLATTHLKKTKRKKIHLTNCCCLSTYSFFYITSENRGNVDGFLMFIFLNYQRAKDVGSVEKLCIENRQLT